MKEIVIRLQVPDDCSVRVEGADGSATARGNSRGGSSSRDGNGSRRSGEGGSGSASEKQRKLVYARAKNAGVAVEAVCEYLDIPSLGALDWQMIDRALEFLEGGGEQQVDAPAEASGDDSNRVPF